MAEVCLLLPCIYQNAYLRIFVFSYIIPYTVLTSLITVTYFKMSTFDIIEHQSDGKHLVCQLTIKSQSCFKLKKKTKSGNSDFSPPCPSPYLFCTSFHLHIEPFNCLYYKCSKIFNFTELLLLLFFFLYVPCFESMNLDVLEKGKKKKKVTSCMFPFLSFFKS